MKINFKYDLTYLTNFVGQPRFREEVELWRVEGEPKIVDVVFDDDGVMVLVVPEFLEPHKYLCMKVSPF